LQRPRSHKVRLYPVISCRAFAAKVCQAVPWVFGRYSVFEGQGQLPSCLGGAGQKLPDKARNGHGGGCDGVRIVGCRDKEVVDLVVVHKHGSGICCLCVGNLHDEGVIMILMIIIINKILLIIIIIITIIIMEKIKIKKNKK
jgi:hypothetical protein